MAKADVLSLVTNFSNSQADPTLADDYYDNVMTDLAQQPWLIGGHLIAVGANTGEFTLTATEGKLLGVFYDNWLLDRTTERALEQHNPNWRDAFGTPVAYLTENEPAKTFRIYPIPTLASQPLSFVFGEPLGRDYPLYTLAAFVTEIRANVPAWMEMAVAWQVLAREYGHESNHRDDDFAMVSQQIADVLFSMVA